MAPKTAASLNAVCMYVCVCACVGEEWFESAFTDGGREEQHPGETVEALTSTAAASTSKLLCSQPSNVVGLQNESLPAVVRFLCHLHGVHPLLPCVREWVLSL